MDVDNLIVEIEKIIDETKTAVFATIGDGNSPDLRWVSPVILRGKKNVIYMMTSPDSRKVEQLKTNPNVRWLFQNRSLTKIIKV